MMRIRRSGTRARGGNRAGFSMIEVMISMTILAVVLSSLAGLSFMVAERGKANAVTTKRNFVLQQQANRLGAMTADALLAEGSTTKVMTVGDFTFTRAITITTVSAKQWRIKVKITPADDPTRPDSIIFDRSRPATGTPLCTIC